MKAIADELERIIWDDDEEKRYRDWVHQQDLRRDSTAAEWSELDAEAAYRTQLKDQLAADAAENPVREWSDDTEREFRRRYMEMR